MATLSNNEIFTTLIALFLLLFSSFICGKLCELIKMPKVVGEITGGILLGGTLFGHFFPDTFQSIFNAFPEEQKLLNIFYQLGLIFLMFISGYNTTVDINRKNIRNSALLFTGATIIPFLLGIPFINLFKSHYIGEANNDTAFAIVFLIAAAVTSIPVISKIFFDLNMMDTKFSNMILTVSTIQDLCLWIALNMAVLLVQGQQLTFWSFIITSVTTIALLGLATLIDFLFKKYKVSIKREQIPIALLIVLGIVILLIKLHINIMYSAFIAGYLAKALIPQKESVEKIKDFSFAFFIPIYFALVGIQINLLNNFSFGRFLLYFIIAFGLEFVGTMATMIFTKYNKITKLTFGITMNARGGPGIVLATTAYSYGIINSEFFAVLILVTMISSAIAGYWIRTFKEQLNV